MTKSDLIERVREKFQGLNKKDAEVIVDLVFDSMTEALKQGEGIEIRGFGSFQVRQREARLGRNPKTGDKVQVSSRKTPFFKVGKELRERINSHPKSTGEKG